jgi:hypothetical protein
MNDHPLDLGLDAIEAFTVLAAQEFEHHRKDS